MVIINRMSSATIYIGGKPSASAIPLDSLIFQLSFKSNNNLPEYTDVIYDSINSSFNSCKIIYMYDKANIIIDTQRGNVLQLNLLTDNWTYNYNAVMAPPIQINTTPINGNSWTYMLWIYYTFVFNDILLLRISNNNNVLLNISISANTLYYSYVSTVNIPTNTWIHLTLRYDIAALGNRLNIYKNGIFVFNGPLFYATYNLISSATIFQIGAFAFQLPNTYLNIDNCRLYNRVLSENEIWIIYSSENTITQGISNCFQGNLYYTSVFNRAMTSYEIATYNSIINSPNNTNNLIGYNYIPKSPLIIVSANNIYPSNYTLSSGLNLLDTYSSSSVIYNGTNYTIQFPSQNITWTNGFSVLLQFQYNTPSTTMTVLSITTTSLYITSVGFYISITSGNVLQYNILNPINTLTTVASAVLIPNQIYNIAFSYNNATTTATLYINGVLTQTTISITQIASLTSGAYPYIYTGGVNINLTYFNGSIYYLSFYNKTLLNTEISNFYPISYNNLLTTVSVNTNTDLTTQPFSGYPVLALTPSGSYPQIVNNSIFYPITDNANTMSYQFTGLNSQYYLFNPIKLILNNGLTLITQFSWSNTNTPISTLCTFSQSNSIIPINYISLQQTGYSNLSLIYNNTAIQNINIATISPGSNYNFAATFNGTASTIYLNGSNMSTTSITQIPANASTATSYGYPYVGCFQSGSNYPTSFFTGNINYLALYNRVLTSTEITNMNNNIFNYTQISPQIPLKASYFYQAITNAPLYLYFDAETLNTYDGLTAGQYIQTWTNLGSEGGTALNAIGGNIGTTIVLPQLLQYRSQNNNRYYVQFTGTGTSAGGNFLTIPALTLNLGGTGATFIFVASMQQNASFQRFIDFSSAYNTTTNDIIICNSTATNKLGTAVPASASTVNASTVVNIDATLRIYVVRLTQNGTIQHFYNNGTNTGTQLTDTFTYTIQSLTTYASCFISRSNTPTDVYGNMALGEFLMYRTALSDASINAIIATMQNRWNLDSSSQNTVNTQNGINFNPKTSLGATSTCALWLDAADTTTITNYTSTSETLSQWTDKSANAYAMVPNAQATAPFYKTNALNNKPGIVFTGGQALGNTGVGSWSFSSNHTIFIVLSNTQGGALFAKLTSNAVPTSYTAAPQRLYWLGDGMQDKGGYSGLYPTFTGYAQGWCNSIQSILSYGQNANGFVICFKYISLYSLGIYINGIQMQVINSLNQANPDTSGMFWIGNSITATGLGPINYLNGAIHEIIAYNTSLGDNDRLLVNNYLMNKWGILSTATPQITNNGVLSKSSLYNFPTMPFQLYNAGTFGNTGPTTISLQTAYSIITNYTASTLGSPQIPFLLNNNYLQSVNGIQSLVVPMTGMYQFIIAGASGGYVSTANAGKGIIIIGNYYLYQGQTLEILIGQPGKSSYQNSSGSGSSGGGGTYISLNGNLLFVAGGGGGTGWTTTTENASTYANAVLTPYGNPGAPLTSATISPGSGGIGGNGGGGANSAGGGGGYYGSGLNTNPGLSYIAGGYGGIRISYITTGLLAYYDFASTVSYPGSGTVLNDLSGNGYNMTLINGAAFNATGAISESWTPTTYGTVPYTVGFASAFSVELLFSISDLNNNEWLFSYGTYATAGCISLVSSVSQLQIYVGNRGYPSGTAYTTGILAINNWYHLVITISTTVTAYYLNGVLQTLTSAPSFSGDFPLTAGANLILGNTPTLNSGPFAGSKIAMARIYNIALTQTQVQQNYAAALNKLSNNPYLLTPPNVGGFGGGGMSTLGAVGSSSSGGGGGGYSGGGSGGLATTVGGAGGGGGSYDISGYNNVATIYTGAIPYFYQISSISQNSILITATSAPYIITVSSTINLFIGQTVVTSGTTFGSIATATTYYIYSIINARTVTFATVNTLATQLTVTNATGTMVGTLTAFTTGTNVGYNLGPGFVYINMINTNTQSLANYQLQTLPKGILQNSLYRQILYPLDTLNQYSRASACGIYSLRLLSSCYTGPLVQLRRDTDNAIIDFYGNYDGILKTLNKQTVESWASGTIAYIVKWYDQSGYGNHANQYTITIQPILNYIIGQVDFKFSRYLNLPIGTVPSTNSEYSVILRHNTVGYGIPITTNAPGFLNSGTQTITTATGIANTMTSWTMTTTGLYSDNWAASLQSPSGWYSSNNSVSFVYNLANRYQYINGISSVTPLASTVHANTTANNAIGASGGGYLNGELYNICIFNTALLDSERNIIEKIPYGNTLTSYSTDPYYNDVNLLLHCDSINEYTSSTLNGNLVDSSIYKQKVVNLNISGNMRANSSYNNFIGGQSIYFDGTPTNYINITNGIGATYPNIFTAFGGIKTGPINISGTNYYIHTFLSTDTFTIINTALTIDLLIVAGGGGGGSTNDRTAGGGGAGGFLYYANSNYLPGSYGIVVGNGGAGGIGLGYNSTNGNNGGNSSFGGNLIAYGGGGGAGTNSSIAGTGGSGGGKTHNSGSTAGSNVLGQGYIGGAIAYDSGNGATGSFAASGGGGAGAIGGNGTSSGGGAGGIGVQNGITGSTVYYAGGGGGSIQNLGSAGPVGGAGGSGGGGAGATTLGPNQSTIAISGNNATYYGGGGGGAAANSAINGTILANTGGNGYQGIVILRYRA